MNIQLLLVSRSWTATSTTNAPQGRYEHTAVWSGSEMIVWGGFFRGDPLNNGGKYNPGTDSLDSYQHNGRAGRSGPSYVSLDQQRDDHLGWMG